MANTGLLGFFYYNNREGNIRSGKPANNDDPVLAFNKLKEAVAEIKAKNIEVYLSVGGWDYSCNPKLYC